MAAYENEFSNFPQQKITLHGFKNVDNSVGDIINQINVLRSQGQYNQAQDIIDANIGVLEKYIVDATTIRTLEEEIYNTQTYAKQCSQVIHVEDTEPTSAIDGDVWIGV